MDVFLGVDEVGERKKAKAAYMGRNYMLLIGYLRLTLPN